MSAGKLREEWLKKVKDNPTLEFIISKEKSDFINSNEMENYNLENYNYDKAITIPAFLLFALKTRFVNLYSNCPSSNSDNDIAKQALLLISEKNADCNNIKESSSELLLLLTSLDNMFKNQLDITFNKGTRKLVQEIKMKAAVVASFDMKKKKLTSSKEDHLVQLFTDIIVIYTVSNRIYSLKAWFDINNVEIIANTRPNSKGLFVI